MLTSSGALILVGLGFQHARSTAPEKRILAPKAEPVPVA